MSLISRARQYDVATYWEKTGTDSGGDPIFAAPVEINVRWDDVQVEYILPDGEKAMSNSAVMVPIDIPLGSLILHAPLASVKYLRRPYDNKGTYEVRQMLTLNNKRNTESLRTVMV